MKINLIILTFALVLVGSFSISASVMAQGPYLGINSSVVAVNDIDLSGAEFQSDIGLGIGIVGGYDFGRYRLEGELTYRKNEVDHVEIHSWGQGNMTGDGDITSKSFLVNGYFDFENKTRFTPYMGFGLGLANIAFNNIKAKGIDLVDDDSSALAAQLAVGCSYSINKLLSVDLGFRYFFTDELEVTNKFGHDVSADSYKSHSFMGGLRVFF